MAPLHADTNFALDQEARDKRNQQFWRRTIIRGLLSYIDSLLWHLKQGMPIFASISNVQLTSADLEIIRERRTVKINGKTEIRSNHLKFRDNIKATFSLFGKVCGLKFKVTCDKDFDALCNTYNRRSHLMHPKKPSDLNVTDSDIAVSKQGVKWLQRDYGRLMTACEQAMLQIQETVTKGK